MAKYTFKTTDEGSGGSYIKQAGRYTFKVDKIEDKFVNGHDVSDIHISDVETGDRMKDSLHYTDKAEWRLIMFMKACKHPPIWQSQGIEITEAGFIGKTFVADVIMEQDSNDPTKQWPRTDKFVTDGYPHASLFLDKIEGSAPAPAAAPTPAPAATVKESLTVQANVW